MILVKIARGSYDPGHMLEFKRSRYSSTAGKGRQQAGGGARWSMWPRESPAPCARRPPRVALGPPETRGPKLTHA